MLALFGDSLAVARAASALVGTWTVPLVWWMVRTVGPHPPPAPPTLRPPAIRPTALAAAGLVATSLWHLHFSRFGIRAILLPAFVAVVIAAWWTAVHAATPARRRRAAAGAGLALGLAAYAHPAGRGLIALPAAHALWLALAARRGRADAAGPRPWAALASAAAVGGAVALPLALTWLRQPWLATSHAEEVSILGQGWPAVAANASRVAAMFHVAGDPAPWRNVPGRPAFDVLAGIAFAVGLGVAVRAAWRGASWAVLALLALAGLALPSVLTDQAPNFSRAIGVVPIAAWLAAVGIDATAAALARWPRAAARRRAAPALAWQLPLFIVASSALVTAHDLRAYAADPATRVAFDADVEAFARWADTLPDDPRAVTSPRTADHATVRAVAARPPAAVDARAGLVVPIDAEGRGAIRCLDVARLPWSPDQAAALDGWARAGLPGIVLTLAGGHADAGRTGVGAGGGDPSLPPPPAATGLLHDVVVRADAGAALAAAAGAPRWDGRITLVAAAVPARLAPGRTVDVVLAWRADGPTARSLSTAVQLVTAAGDAVASGDGLPAGGSAPTDRWRAGDLVLSRHAVAVPADAPPGPAVVNVGWYALSYPDGPSGAPRFETVADDRGRAVARAGATVIAGPGAAGGDR